MKRPKYHVTHNAARLYYKIISGNDLAIAVTPSLQNCFYWDARACLETAHWFAKMAKELKAKRKEAKRNGNR